MMSNEPDLLERLRLIYGKLPEDQKPLFSEVANTLKAQAQQIEALKAEIKSPLPEAPTSATVKIVNPATQAEWLFTVRGHDATDLARRLPVAEHQLFSELGYIAMDAYVDQRRAERKQNATQSASQPAANVPPPAQSNGGDKTSAFSAKELSINVNDGKPYFKVKGGKFTKFGVTVWPEVLQAAGYDVDALNPMQTYSLAGYEAVYSTNEDGHRKVIELRQE